MKYGFSSVRCKRNVEDDGNCPSSFYTLRLCGCVGWTWKNREKILLFNRDEAIRNNKCFFSLLLFLLDDEDETKTILVTHTHRRATKWIIETGKDQKNIRGSCNTWKRFLFLYFFTAVVVVDVVKRRREYNTRNEPVGRKNPRKDPPHMKSKTIILYNAYILDATATSTAGNVYDIIFIHMYTYIVWLTMRYRFICFIPSGFVTARYIVPSNPARPSISIRARGRLLFTSVNVYTQRNTCII